MNFGNWRNDQHTQHYGLYAQDSWTKDRFTFQGAVRYEHAWSYFPAGQGWDGPDLFHSEPVVFDEVIGVPGFNDIMFRGGMSWDLFGTGKTALKLFAGQYVQSANNQDRYTTGNPANSFARTTNRNWNDRDRDYVPDCDLMNPDANGECSQWLTPNFGSVTSVNTVNPAILEGWGVRPSDNQYSVGIQHELVPRVSAEFSYHWRTFAGFTVTDDRALGPEDYDQFTITAPSDPRLPGGGGYPVTTVAVNKIVASDNYVTFASDYGKQSQYWHGFDVNVNARLRNGLLLQGGTSTGRGVRDNCDITAALPETLFVGGPGGGWQQVDSCHVTEPFQTQLRGLVNYVVPRIEVQLSATFQFKPGTGGIGGNDNASNGSSLDANWFAPASVIVPALGRPLVAGGTGQTINLNVPGQLYGNRINQVDLRVAKILRLGGTRTMIGFDLYNLFNSNPTLTWDENYGVNYLRPTAILMPRFVRFNATVDF
jgi:hypothetical protein